MFIGEQDGPPETEFKNRVAAMLSRSAVVRRAYLARVMYDAEQTEIVALCLFAPQPSEEMLQDIGALFASMFGQEQHLDVLFIDEVQEHDVARVCAPFWAR